VVLFLLFFECINEFSFGFDDLLVHFDLWIDGSESVFDSLGLFLDIIKWLLLFLEGRNGTISNINSSSVFRKFLSHNSGLFFIDHFVFRH
jgi:hypothetical protein